MILASLPSSSGVGPVDDLGILAVVLGRGALVAEEAGDVEAVAAAALPRGDGGEEERLVTLAEVLEEGRLVNAGEAERLLGGGSVHGCLLRAALLERAAGRPRLRRGGVRAGEHLV